LKYKMQTNIPSYIVAAYGIRGSLDFTALCRSFGDLIARHEMLRSAFAHGDGRHRSVQVPRATQLISIFDLSRFPSTAQGAELERLAVRDAREPFDVKVAPLIRVTLVRRAPDWHVLLITLHQ